MKLGRSSGVLYVSRPQTWGRAPQQARGMFNSIFYVFRLTFVINLQKKLRTEMKRGRELRVEDSGKSA